MADIAIVYCSVHHGNTKKLLDGIAGACEVDLLDTAQAEKADLSQYRAVGFASGVYMSKLHRALFDFIGGNPALPRRAFILYTSGSGGKKYADSFAARLKERGLRVDGVYSCKGYDTFGPFKLVGGIAKGHPSQSEIDGGVRFVKDILERKDDA
jgi:flavodoxin